MKFVALQCFFLKKEQNYKGAVVKIVILHTALQSVSQMYVLQHYGTQSVVHFRGFPCLPLKGKVIVILAT